MKILSFRRSIMKGILPLVLLILCLGALAATDDYRKASEADTAYKNGDYTEARSLAKELRFSKDPNIQIYGLMIEGVTDSNPTQGLNLLTEALERIRSTKTTSKEQRDYLNKFLHNVLLAEINLLIQCEELSTAHAKLDTYKDAFPGANQAAITLAYAKIAFLKHEYPKALKLAIDAYDRYSLDDPRRAAQVLIKVGLYQMLAGDVDEGFKTTLKAQAGLVKEGDSDQYYFSLVNMLIYHKNRGSDGGSLVKSIANRLSQEPDKDLEMLLEFAKEWRP